MSNFMLTTVDNPFNPFTEWAEWFSFDATSGYNTPAFLARIVKTSDDLSEADEDVAIDDAIDEIINENVLGVYIKINKNGEKSMETKK